jgi:hypothetical protein
MRLSRSINAGQAQALLEGTLHWRIITTWFHLGIFEMVIGFSIVLGVIFTSKMYQKHRRQDLPIEYTHWNRSR